MARCITSYTNRQQQQIQPCHLCREEGVQADFGGQRQEKMLLSSESSLRTASCFGHLQGHLTTLGWGTPPSFYVWPPLQTLANSHCPDPKLFPDPRCFVRCLRLMSSALRQLCMPGLLSKAKALTSLLCSMGFYILVTIMFFALF